MRYKFAFCYLLLFASFCSFATSEQKVIIYGEASYRPYAWVEDGVYQGIYVDILEQIFKKMDGYNVILKPVPWERGLHLLELGEAFALFPPYYHPDNRPYISPYSDPILSEKTILVCRKGIFNSERKRWPEDYYGLTIGQSSGYLMGGKKFFAAVKEGKILVSESLRTGQNLLMVATNRIDCYINDELAIKTEEVLLSQYPKYKKLIDELEAGLTLSHEHGYLGFTNVKVENYPYKQNFVSQFNRALRQVKQSGEIERIVEKYTGRLDEMTLP